MSSILVIYGLIVSIFILKRIDFKNYSWRKGYNDLAAGLLQGLSAMFSGGVLGIIGDIGVRKFVHEEKIYTGMLLLLIFAEVVALYGVIVAVIMTS